MQWGGVQVDPPWLLLYYKFDKKNCKITRKNEIMLENTK